MAVDSNTVQVLSIALAAIAAVFSAWAAWSAQRQLRYDQDAAGGRAIAFDVAVAEQGAFEGKRRANYTVRLELFGPGKRYEAELCLCRRGGYYVTNLGQEFERDGNTPQDGRLKQTWKAMASTDDPVQWDFSVTPASAVTDDIWCLFTWIDPRGEAVWTGAYARRLTNPSVLYEWRWYKTRAIRKRIQRWGAADRHKQWPWHRFAGKPRPLGRWRTDPNDGGLIGIQGPARNLDNVR